jgi:hypothetical protein
MSTFCKKCKKRINGWWNKEYIEGDFCKEHLGQMKDDILDNTMDIDSFIRTIVHYQKLYWNLEDSIKPNARVNPVTAEQVERVNKEMNYIAEQVAKFILNRNTKVNIYNFKQLPEEVNK